MIELFEFEGILEILEWNFKEGGILRRDIFEGGWKFMERWIFMENGIF